MDQKHSNLSGNFLLIATMLATGRLVTEENIISVIFDARGRDEKQGARANIKTTVCRLRKLLKQKYDIDLPHAKWKFGLRLSPEHAAKLRVVLRDLHTDNVTGGYKARLKYAAETFRKAQEITEQALRDDVEIV